MSLISKVLLTLVFGKPNEKRDLHSMNEEVHRDPQCTVHNQFIDSPEKENVLDGKSEQKSEDELIEDDQQQREQQKQPPFSKFESTNMKQDESFTEFPVLFSNPTISNLHSQTSRKRESSPLPSSPSSLSSSSSSASIYSPSLPKSNDHSPHLPQTKNPLKQIKIFQSTEILGPNSCFKIPDKFKVQEFQPNLRQEFIIIKKDGE